MNRTIVSLPLDPEMAKEASVQAGRLGKTRTEYLRDLVSGHLRSARFREARGIVQEHWKPSWPQDEDAVQDLVKGARRRPAKP
jgi:hypothetical protein